MTMGIFKIVHESCSRVGCTPLVRVDGPEFELHSRRKLNLPCRILHLHSDLQSFSVFFLYKLTRVLYMWKYHQIPYNRNPVKDIVAFLYLIDTSLWITAVDPLLGLMLLVDYCGGSPPRTYVTLMLVLSIHVNNNIEQ